MKIMFLKNILSLIFNYLTWQYYLEYQQPPVLKDSIPTFSLQDVNPKQIKIMYFICYLKTDQLSFITLACL